MKSALLACVSALVLTTSLPIFADTLKLVSATGEVVGGEYVYPYNFSVNGASDLKPLMCLNLNRNVTLGESWFVNIASTPLDSSIVSTNERADAWIFSQLGSYSNADVQYAVWDIFDPTDTNGHAGFTAAAQQLAKDGRMMAQNTSLINSGFFSKYDVYTSTSNQSGWTAGQPQDFVGVAQTPEPSSLMLMGTGVLGAAFLLRLRKRGAALL